MALPPLQAGKNFVFSLETAPGAGTYTDISSYVADPSMQMTYDMLEAITAGGRNQTPGFSKNEVNLKGPWSTTIDAILGPLHNPSATDSLGWKFYPAGNSSGKPLYAGDGWFSDYQITGAASGLREWSAKLTVPGDITRTTV